MFLVVGMLAYGIVGILFSIGVLHGKQAYAFVFFLLLLAGYGVYKGLEKLRLLTLALPLAVKIIVPVFIVLVIIGIVAAIVLSKKEGEKQCRLTTILSKEF